MQNKRACSFECSPDNHISKKRGCPDCGGSKRKTFAIFKEQADTVLFVVECNKYLTDLRGDVVLKMNFNNFLNIYDKYAKSKESYTDLMIF